MKSHQFIRRKISFAPPLQIVNPICMLEVEGLSPAYFQEFMNFGKEQEVIQHRIIIDDHEIVQKLPGRLRYKKVTLKREITDDLRMWEWRRLVEFGDIENARRNCILTAYNGTMDVIASWTMNNVWPLGVVLERESRGWNFEVVTLATESFTRES